MQGRISLMNTEEDRLTVEACAVATLPLEDEKEESEEPPELQKDEDGEMKTPADNKGNIAREVGNFAKRMELQGQGIARRLWDSVSPKRKGKGETGIDDDGSIDDVMDEGDEEKTELRGCTEAEAGEACEGEAKSKRYEQGGKPTIELEQRLDQRKQQAEELRKKNKDKKLQELRNQSRKQEGEEKDNELQQQRQTGCHNLNKWREENRKDIRNKGWDVDYMVPGLHGWKIGEEVMAREKKGNTAKKGKISYLHKIHGIKVEWTEEGGESGWIRNLKGKLWQGMVERVEVSREPGEDPGKQRV